MSSVAQVEANRLNAQKSTGPRTPEGKARVAANAIRHGLLCEKAFIDGEDFALFDEHCRSMKESLAPVGAIEEELADRVAAQSWRLRRATGIEGLFLHRQLGQHGLLEDEYAGGARRRAALAGEPMPAEDEQRSRRRGRAVWDFFHEGGVRSLDIMRRYERSIDQSFRQALRDLMTLQDARKGKGDRQLFRGEKVASPLFPPAELPRGKALVEAIARDPEASKLLREFARDTFEEARRAAMVELAAAEAGKTGAGAVACPSSGQATSRGQGVSERGLRQEAPQTTAPASEAGDSEAQVVSQKNVTEVARKPSTPRQTKPISRDPSHLEELVQKVEQAEDELEASFAAAAAGA